MKVVLVFCLISSLLYPQEITYSGSIESGLGHWGLGIDIYIIPDTAVILTTGLAFSSEYGKKDPPGIYAWSPPAPHSWWKFRGDHETLKTFPGITFGVLFFRTVHLSVLLDYTTYDKYKIWYSPAIDSEFHTKNGNQTKFGSGVGLQVKISPRNYLGVTYHHIKGFGIKYTFAGV